MSIKMTVLINSKYIRPHNPHTTDSLNAGYYLGRAVGIHVYHIFRSLFHFELDVGLFLQSGQSAIVGGRPGFTLGGVWG